MTAIKIKVAELYEIGTVSMVSFAEIWYREFTALMRLVPAPETKPHFHRSKHFGWIGKSASTVAHRTRSNEYTKSFRELSQRLSKDDSKVYFDLEGQEIYQNFKAKIGRGHGLRGWDEDLGEGSYATTMQPSSAKVIDVFLGLAAGTISASSLPKKKNLGRVPKRTQTDGNDENDESSKKLNAAPSEKLKAAAPKKLKAAVTTAPNDQTPNCGVICNRCRKGKVDCVWDIDGQKCKVCREKGHRCFVPRVPYAGD